MENTTPLVAVVGALVDSGSEIATILRHMEAFRTSGLSSPEVPEPRDVLHGLLVDVLGSPLAEFGDAALVNAARVLTAASKAMCDELLLVPLSSTCERPTPRRRR